MKDILAYVKKEPAVLLSLVGAVIALLASFGFDLTNEQVGAIMAVVAVTLGVLTRQAVTPNVSVAALVEKGNVVAGKAASPPLEEGEDVVVSEDDGLSRLDRLDGLGSPPSWRQGTLDERGYADGNLLVVIAAIVVIIAGLIFIFRALT